VRQKFLIPVDSPALVGEELKFLCGRYFKRFDHENCTFMSNIREEYPED
jgi:F-box protein 21